MNASVLVIEDTPANMKLVTMLLRREGYAVLQAEEASTGIALARAHRPDLILMDIQLPGMDGLDATRLLKADPVTGAIPVLALTAFAMKGDEDRIRAAGCDGYVSKPIQYQSFLDNVRRFLQPRAAMEVHHG